MSEIVRVARQWRGVRFAHQGRNRHGVDCAGLPWCVYRELGVTMTDFRSYAHESNPVILLGELREAMGPEVAVEPVTEADLQAGDIVLFKFHRRGPPHHLGIVADRPGGGFNYIDADGMQGYVTERRLSPKYLSYVTHVFRRPV